MAKIISAVCDRCLDDDPDARVPAVSLRSAQFDRQTRPRTIDLCEACEEWWKEITEFVARVSAEIAEKPTRRRVVGDDKSDDARQTSGLECPQCGNGAGDMSNMRRHIRRIHPDWYYSDDGEEWIRTNYKARRRENVPAHCKWCDVTRESRQGLGSHQRSAHPDKWAGVAEVREEAA
jgi:hypothetical protein